MGQHAPTLGVCFKVLRYTLLATPPPLSTVACTDTAGVVTAQEVCAVDRVVYCFGIAVNTLRASPDYLICHCGCCDHCHRSSTCSCTGSGLCRCRS